MNNRTLRRPMFRMGGSTGEGITSGLDMPKPDASRQSYQFGKTVDNIRRDMPGLKELYRENMAPRGNNFNDFLINMGLDLVSRPQSGNIFTQVAASAKEPYAQFTKGKQSAEEQRYASESDMFKTLIAAKADMAGGTGGKTYAKLEIANDIEKTMTEIIKLETRIKSGEENLENQLNKKQARLNYLSKENTIGKSLMQQTDFAEKVLKGITKTLVAETIIQPDGTKKLKYPEGKSDPELLKEAFRQYAAFFENVPEVETEEEEKADGGRIGYQEGMSVQPAGMPMGQEPMTMDQGPKIDYATLRARLPQEITDDIVKLIAASPEALEDFATIATQQDVDQFNKTYNVNLVLPAEA